MKKSILAMGVATAMLMASCEKNYNMEKNTHPDATDGARVAITLTGAGDTTRASFDDTAAAESWEKSLSSLSVFAFDTGGSLIIRRDFTDEELSGRSATFSLPKSAAKTACSFYAVANFDASSARTKTSLLSLVESAAASYNGTFAEVSSAAKRPKGFVMSGSADVTIGEVNSTTQVGIALKRTVAKVALQAFIDPSFAQKYAGSLTINSVKLSKAPTQCKLIGGSTPTPGEMTFTHSQMPAAKNGTFDALFYVYETYALVIGDRVMLEIIATYDADANSSTTNDRSEVTYSLELEGRAAGNILRNGYYRVEARIKGLVGQDCNVSITAADWETPVTQTVDLGA